jgi:hypothetical protein
MGALSTTVAAFAVRNGVDARETAPEGAQGQSVGATASMMTLARQGTAHYAMPVDGSRTLVAGPFPDYDPAYPVKTLTVRPTGDGREVWEIRAVYDLPPLQTVLIEPGQWLGEIRPIAGAPAFLSEPL